mmetsp:Transcript_75435/g.219117  ORF Transcript_75435/g.219117 Transcript_75435/m.219117 type:complete len:101 (+) Transcript_75435:244-546(+)
MLLVASSRKTNFGARRMTCAITTRCCSPPDSTFDQSADLLSAATAAASGSAGRWASTSPASSAASGSLGSASVSTSGGDPRATRRVKPTSSNTSSTCLSL